MSYAPTFVIFGASKAKIVAACYKFQFTHSGGEE